MSAVSYSTRITASNPLFFVRRAVALALVSLAALDAAAAALSLNEAEVLAVAGEPAASGLVARAESLQEAALAASVLPDPKLRFGLMNFPLEQGGFGTEGMTQVLVGMHQPLPAAASRTARADMTEAKADSFAHQAEARYREVLEATRQAWLESHRWQQARALTERSRTVFTDLVTITAAAYAVGRRSQHEFKQAELELARLEDRLASMAGSEAMARAALGQWVGQANAARPVDEQLPSWSAPRPLDDLLADVGSHPLVGAADAGIAGEIAAVQLAEAAYRPDWGLDVSYGYRDGRLPDGRSRSDFFSVMVTVDMPVFRKRRQDRQLAASQSGKRAAIDQRGAMIRQLSRELGVAHARYTSLDARIGYYDSTIAARSREGAQAALAAYQSGAGDFNDLVRSHLAQLDIELERLNLAVDRAHARARIAWLTEER